MAPSRGVWTTPSPTARAAPFHKPSTRRRRISARRGPPAERVPPPVAVGGEEAVPPDPGRALHADHRLPKPRPEPAGGAPAARGGRGGGKAPDNGHRAAGRKEGNPDPPPCRARSSAM